MGTPHIYYYPTGTNLEVIDLAEELSDLTETPGADVEDAVTLDGLFSRNLLRQTYKVRLFLERFGSLGGSSLERKLKTLEAHLFAGGVIGFTRDETRTYCSVSGGAFTRGQGIFYGTINPFTSWYPATPQVNDEIVVESSGPGARRELTTVSSYAGGQVGLADSARYDHPGSPLIRWRDFYPVLYLAKEDLRSTVIHDHRRNFTWEVTLTYAPAAVISLLQQRPTLADISGSVTEALTSLDVGLSDRFLINRIGAEFAREQAANYQRLTAGALDPRLRGL